jgi:hypothetical protein
MHTPFLKMPAARFIALAVLALAASACGSSGPTHNGSAQSSASGVLRTALHDATKAGSMRFTITTQSNGATQSVAGDTSTKGGAVVVTSASGVVHILVDGSNGYIESNSSAALGSALGLSASLASANVNKWISVTPADAPFDALQTATSFSSTLAEFTPGGSHLRLTHRTVAKHGVQDIDGTGTAVQAVGSYDIQIVLTQTKPVLPIGGGVTVKGNGKTVTQIALFAKWGGPLPLAPPSNATPFSQIEKG